MGVSVHTRVPTDPTPPPTYKAPANPSTYPQQQIPHQSNPIKQQRAAVRLLPRAVLRPRARPAHPRAQARLGDGGAAAGTYIQICVVYIHIHICPVSWDGWSVVGRHFKLTYGRIVPSHHLLTPPPNPHTIRDTRPPTDAERLPLLPGRGHGDAPPHPPLHPLHRQGTFYRIHLNGSIFFFRVRA